MVLVNLVFLIDGLEPAFQIESEQTAASQLALNCVQTTSIASEPKSNQISSFIFLGIGVTNSSSNLNLGVLHAGHLTQGPSPTAFKMTASLTLVDSKKEFHSSGLSPPA